MHSLTLPFQRVYLLALCAAITIAQSALDVPWSGKKYGPDGPWQAVKIKVGGFDPTLKIDAQNHADIDVYPGGIYNSFTFSKSACNPYPNSACGEGGTWDPDPSAMAWFSNFAQAWHPPLEDKSYGLLAGPLNYTQRALTIRDKTVWNASIAHSNMGNVTYFNGATSGMRLGFLALGAPETVQTFDTAGQEGKSNHNVTGNVYNGKLYEDKTIASYSYSLHIGSAAFEYPGSLVFGGYNKGRAIGPLTTLFEGEDRIDLLDIGIGVEHGDSPFDFDSKSGLLISDTGIVGDPQQVKIDPTTPYLSLPDNTCEGLASTLPIKYDQTSKHYHWQTDDPKYKKIVTSPAYLRFTFPPARGSTNNVTIKVPFALLNLTLETPIVDRPTQYFPCHSFNPLKRQPYPTPDDYFRLGRAFLQAAFISRNWATGTTWMGQAPGPGYKGQGLGDQIIDIEAGDTTLESWESAKTNYFNQSWEGHWSVIDSLKPQASSTDNTNTAPTKENYGSGGLSTGAKAGIGIGAAVVAMIAIGVGILLWRKRAREAGMSEKRASAPACAGHDLPALAADDTHPDAAQESHLLKAPHELYSEAEVQELPDSNDPRVR